MLARHRAGNAHKNSHHRADLPHGWLSQFVFDGAGLRWLSKHRLWHCLEVDIKRTKTCGGGAPGVGGAPVEHGHPTCTGMRRLSASPTNGNGVGSITSTIWTVVHSRLYPVTYFPSG